MEMGSFLKKRPSVPGRLHASSNSLSHLHEMGILFINKSQIIISRLIFFFGMPLPGDAPIDPGRFTEWFLD
jgi:hypothetical protein